jgi:predicted TIM-barrel fold metal-dependent hydrolase
MFDTNAHPTVDGAWIDGRSLCDFGRTEKKLREAGFTHACAVALPGVGSYEPKAFAAAARRGGDFWVPIAAWNSTSYEFAHAVATMKNLVAMGYRGVKVHPRLLKHMPEAEELGIVVAAAHEVGIPTLICSYPFGNPASNLRGNLLEILSRALQQCPQAPVMLLHAGCVDFLRFVEFARANANVLLDLSFTIMKYEGSSMDADLQFAFRTFDQRICLGSDFPEFEFVDVCSRFHQLAMTTGIDQKKARNIALLNACRFFDIG